MDASKTTKSTKILVLEVLGYTVRSMEPLHWYVCHCIQLIYTVCALQWCTEHTYSPRVNVSGGIIVTSLL